MAIDKKMKNMEVRVYPDARYRLDWHRLQAPSPYGHYWEVFFMGKHVADLFQGKKRCIACVWGRCTIYATDENFKNLCLHVAGFFTSPKN